MSETTPKNNAHCSIPGDPEQSINRFIVVAAKRARQLQGGARSFLPTSSNKKVTTIAMEEVRRGLIKYEILPAKDPKLQIALHTLQYLSGRVEVAELTSRSEPIDQRACESFRGWPLKGPISQGQLAASSTPGFTFWARPQIVGE